MMLVSLPDITTLRSATRILSNMITHNDSLATSYWTHCLKEEHREGGSKMISSVLHLLLLLLLSEVRAHSFAFLFTRRLLSATDSLLLEIVSLFILNAIHGSTTRSYVPSSYSFVLVLIKAMYPYSPLIPTATSDFNWQMKEQPFWIKFSC